MKIHKLQLVLLFLALSTSALAINSTTYGAGSGSYTVNPNVYLIKIEMWSGGGGGGGVTSSGAGFGAGGGGGGAYVSQYITVIPNNNFTFIIGAGGAAGTSAGTSGGNGGSSVINNSQFLVNISGGTGGTGGSPGPGGIGGRNLTSIQNWTFYYGGNATNGVTGSNSGAGGASGGSGGPGGNATYVFGGNTSIPTSGANGAAGRTSTGDGISASNPGGGGGGGYGISSARPGGTGGTGSLIITEYSQGVITINVYNETNGSLITGTNITVVLTSLNTSYTTTTTTGTLTLDNITSGSYTAVFSGTGFSQRSYIVTITQGIFTTLNAYLTSSSLTTIFTIIDSSTGQTVENAVTTQEALIASTWTTVDSKYSDIAGNVLLYYNANQPYRFTISKGNYTSKQFILNPILFGSYDVHITPSVIYSNPQDYNGLSIVFTPDTYTTATQNNFNFIISSPNGTLTGYNYTITFPGGTRNNSGSNAYGSTLTSSFNITGATTSSTVELVYCYTTSLTGLRCFTRSYPVQGVYGNYTLIAAADASTTIGNLEKIVFSTVVTGIIVGAAATGAGPITAGGVWLIMMGIFYLVLKFNIWLLLIPAFVGFIMVGYGVMKQ